MGGERVARIEFLREYYGATVLHADGKGDGGVDAWVILRAEPRVRVAAQFHAGKSEPWDSKLKDDAKTIFAFREQLAADDPMRLELTRLRFVCAQTPSATKQEEVTAEVQRDYGIAVQIYDARAIASSAVQNQGRLLGLLARKLPPSSAGPARPTGQRSARDEARLAFAFVHEQPTKYRWEVAKSSIATILHRSQTEIPRDKLLAQATELLRLSAPSRLLDRALRNLEREHKVSIAGELVSASPALAERTATVLAIAAADEDALRQQCEAALEPFLAKGVHYRTQRARRAVEAVFDDLGLLVSSSVAERALSAVDRDVWRLGRSDDERRRRWSAIERKLVSELELDANGVEQAFATLVRIVANAPFARSLAAGELFLRLTEYDADELAVALAGPSRLRVVLDASIAMPMLCALFDRPAPAWQTSVAAHALYEALRGRGATLVVPSVYVEEIAAHLLKARAFESIVATEPELERSRNFFVAHFCSTGRPGDPGTVAEFRDFLAAFGAPRSYSGQWQLKERRRVEDELAKLFRRYDIEVSEVTARPDDPELTDEPEREGVLIRHDRAVVRWVTAQNGPESLLCTADRWLQGVLSESDVIALDSAALADLVELVRPMGSPRELLTPLAIAQVVAEEERVLAASIWDEIVSLEDFRLADWRLLQRAREFRAQWLAGHKDSSVLREEWVEFRDAGPP